MWNLFEWFRLKPDDSQLEWYLISIAVYNEPLKLFLTGPLCLQSTSKQWIPQAKGQ